MNIFELTPLSKPLTATVEIPGSKSLTNRALVMAALTKGAVTLHHPLYCEDTEAMIGCLRALGLRVETLPDRLMVPDDISIVQNKTYELFAKDSGTTLRFLLPLLCLTPGIKVIRGNARLSVRPIKDLVEALRSLGAQIEWTGELPLKILSSTLNSGKKITIDGGISSQFVSAILMVAPLLNGLTIAVSGERVSNPYVDMTIQMMDVKVESRGNSYSVAGGERYQKKDYVVEGDFSSAGYFFAMAALTGSTLTLKNLNPHSAQADLRFLNILADMGNEVHIQDHALTIVGKQILPQALDMKECPDQVQTMAVLAAFAKGVTTISGVRTLRLKETERVLALKNELAKMGIHTEDTHDNLSIYGGNPQAATIRTYGDHRMAMAFAVAGTKLKGMKIENPEVVHKTFPTFWDKLNELA